MKKLNLWVMTLGLIATHAFGIEYDSPFTAQALKGTKPGECQNGNGMIDINILRAIDQHHYEIAMMFGNQVAARGILETTTMVFTSEGRVRLAVKYFGSKDMPLANGFTAKFGLWQECPGGYTFNPNKPN